VKKGSKLRACTSRGRPSLSRVGILRVLEWGEARRAWQDEAATAYWDIVTHSRTSEGAYVLPASSVSMDGSRHYPHAALE
jgi:hypothetical protein